MASSKQATLTVEECHCLLCMEFMVKPVTLPCSHTMCKSCFQSLLRKTNLCCPFCRFWISSWARYHVRRNTVVNMEMWERIQAQYPEECRRLASGEESNLVFPEIQPVRVISNPGELRKEYEEEVTRIVAERQAAEKKENRASKRFIRKLLAEEEAEEKRAEMCRLEEQQKQEGDTGQQDSSPVTTESPRKRKHKRKHCEDAVSMSMFPQSQIQLSLGPEGQEVKETAEETCPSDESSAGQGTNANLPTATPEDPKMQNEGMVPSPQPSTSWFHGGVIEKGPIGDGASEPSCSDKGLFVPSNIIKLGATASHSSKAVPGSSVSDTTQKIGASTSEIANKKSHPQGGKCISKRKHQKSSAAVGAPCTSGDKSPSDEEELQLNITQKLINLERLYFQMHQQEQQDRLFALRLQRQLEKEERLKIREEIFLRRHQVHKAPPADDEVDKENSKDKIL